MISAMQSHAHLTVTVPGPEHPVELQNLLFEAMQLCPENCETGAGYVGRDSLAPAALEFDRQAQHLPEKCSC